MLQSRFEEGNRHIRMALHLIVLKLDIFIAHAGHGSPAGIEEHEQRHLDDVVLRLHCIVLRLVIEFIRFSLVKSMFSGMMCSLAQFLKGSVLSTSFSIFWCRDPSRCR